MKYNIISDYDSADIEKWKMFVRNHSNGNIFQTPDMYNLFKSEKYYEPVMVICSNQENDILGVLVSVIQREYKGLLGKLSSRSIIWGGPLVKDNNIEIFNIILKEYCIIVRKKAVYTQVRNLFHTDIFMNEFNLSGYKFEDHLNILIKLDNSVDELWKNVYSRRRSQINKSERLGISIRIFDDEELIDESYKILQEVYKKAKLPLAGIEFFRASNNVLGKSGYLKFFGAFYKNKLIGVMYLLCYKERTYEWYIGSYQDNLRMHPNDLIIWEIIKWSKKNNYLLFDFGGAGSPDKEYGVREYKKKFGGETENFGRYQKIHSRFLMLVSVTGFRIWQFIKFGLKSN